MIDVISVIIAFLRVLLGFVLVLFIPGFFLTLVFFPKISEIQIFERLVYSVVLSIGTVIASVLFMDVALGVNTTPLNIVFGILSVSFVFIIIWILRLYFPETFMRIKKFFILKFYTLKMKK